MPGSPTSMSSPTLTGAHVHSHFVFALLPAWICLECTVFSCPRLDLTPIANGSAADENPANKPVLIPNGGPSTMVPCSPETPLANGVANGHVTPVQESPFIGYIIAMHRKMVRTLRKCSALYYTIQYVRKNTYCE